MKLTLGFSPCPNDTFIFDALVNNKIDTQGLDFRPVLEDVQTLNEQAQEGKLDITKVSYAVLPLISDNYLALNSGGALGKGVGPLLISKKQIEPSAINDLIIAIPGEHTTAHMLFSMAFPEAKNKNFMLFSDIENAVLDEKADVGVIIHENRFTYETKGLNKIMDLGEYWEKETSCPIPLGGIVIRRNMDEFLQQKVNELIRESIRYSQQQYPVISDYVKQHAQEMDEIVMRKHIELYVNEYSLDIGADGKKAVSTLSEVLTAQTSDENNFTVDNLFLE